MTNNSDSILDVVIVGAGPAGLSAALILGRCRRRVLIIDAGRPRNAASHALHGYLTRDGIEPAELLRIGREQLQPYTSVELRAGEVIAASSVSGRFEIMLKNEKPLRSKKLLLATGVVDHLPDIEGLSEFYGRSVFHCPYCDGWEMRDQPLAVYGREDRGAGLALELTAWSKDLVVCSDGPAKLKPAEREQLASLNIAVREERISRLEGTDGRLERIVFASNQVLERRGMFFNTGQDQGCDLAAKLGCEFTERGAVRTGDFEMTNVPGLFVAGDASRAVQLSIVAAAEGAEAAFAINKALIQEDLAKQSQVRSSIKS
ncbi:MAG: NAD(P)/FAD-dependent oxidoreductase [Pyrinomonadaceae bacterium]